MAQTIKHRRGKLESIASITPINGELIIASGSDLSVHQEGLLFVGVEGNVLTPSNKILTGSATIDVTGGSFDHSVDGIPYYETDAKKLHILGHGGNTNVVFTTNSLDLDGSGIVSSSTQVSELAGIENSTLTITAGDGLKTGGTFTTNQNSDSAVTLNIDVSDFAGTGLEDDGSENLRIAATGVTNAMLAGSIANGKLANSSISIGGISFSLGDTDATPAFDLADATGYLTSNLSGTITNAQLAGSIANGKLANSAITISGTSVSLGGSITDETLFGGVGVVSGSAQIDGSALGSNKTITIGGSSVTLGGTISNSALLEEVVGGTGIQSGSGDIAGVTAGDGLTGGGTSGTVTLAVQVDDSSIEIDSDTVRVKASGITNAMLAGSIANDKLAGSIANGKLANSAITISGTSVSLGSSISDETLFGGTGVISGSSQVSLGGFDTDDLSEGSTNKYATTANVKSALNANLGTATIGDSNDTITIAGNLTVNGTTTYISSANLNIGDNILELNYAGTAADAGLLVKDAVSTGTSGSLLWDASEDYWIAGALGAEGRIIVGNGTDTAGKITKFSADGVITDSIISESGTTVTIANNLVLSGLTASQLVVTNGSKQLVSSTDISSLTLTLDGGEF